MMRHVVIVSVAVALGGALTGCSGSSPKSADAAIEVSEENVTESIVIDVRTPEEFVAGHLDGAINYDFEGGSLEASLADLDPNSSYVLYCRSGRRSALAAQLMTNEGFADVTDLGSLEAAATATGLDIVS